MFKRFKYLFLILGVFLLLILAAGIYLQKGFDPNDYKGRLTTLVKNITGLELRLDGDIALQLFPWVGVTVESASVGNVRGFEGETLVSVKKLGVKARLMPLLRKELEADTVQVEGLELHILRNKEGVTNLQQLPVKDVRVEKDEVVVETQSGEEFALHYFIAGLECQNATIVLDDRQAGRRVSLKNFDIKTGEIKSGMPFDIRLVLDAHVSKPSLSSHISLTGKAMGDPQAMKFRFTDTSYSTTLTGEDLPFTRAEAQLDGDFYLDAQALRVQVENTKAAATVFGGMFSEKGEQLAYAGDAVLDMSQGTLIAPKVSLSGMGVNISGAVQGSRLNTQPDVRVSLDVAPFNPKESLKRLGADIRTTDAAALTKAQLAANLAIQGNMLKFKTKKLVVDQSTINAAGSAVFGAAPAYAVNCTVDAIDVDRYLPPKKGKDGQIKDQKKTKKNSGEAPDIPAALRALTLKSELQIGKLRVQKLQMSNVKTSLVAKNGNIRVKPLTCQLYGGGLNAAATINLAKKTPPLSLNAEVKGVQVEPLLKDMMGKADISGTAAVKLAVNGQGLAEKQLLRSLGGKMSLALKKGVIYGFNFSPDVFQSTEKLIASAKSSDRTEYKSITASATIKKGVAYNKDFLALVPPHKATGSGRVDLAAQTLDYVVKARLVKMAAVPVTLTGPLSDPNVSVDPTAVVQSAVTGAANVLEKAAQDPEGIEKGLEKQLKKGLTDVLDGFLGGKK